MSTEKDWYWPTEEEQAAVARSCLETAKAVLRDIEDAKTTGEAVQKIVLAFARVERVRDAAYDDLFRAHPLERVGMFHLNCRRIVASALLMGLGIGADDPDSPTADFIGDFAAACIALNSAADFDAALELEQGGMRLAQKVYTMLTDGT